MAKIDWPLQLKRQFAAPLDPDAEFNTTAERLAYLSNPLCYPGQEVYDKQEDKHYKVNGNKTGFTAVVRLIADNLGLGVANPVFGTHQLGGGHKLQALANPTTPVITAVGAKGTAAVSEVASLKISGTVTTAGNVTVTLDGVTTTVALALNDTPAMIADKVRAAPYTGWTTYWVTGSDTVQFTASATGPKVDATYSAGTTGATGTMTTTTQGKADTRTLYEYYVVAEDRNGFLTRVSPKGSILDGNPVLDATNYNKISWTVITGAVKYHVLKTNTSTKLGETTGTTLNDTGQATAAYVAPERNSTADLIIDGRLISSGADAPYATEPYVLNAIADSREYGGRQYSTIFFTGTQPGDDSLTVNGAAALAAANYAATGDRQLVHVRAGTYYENEVTRHGVDMYFEEWAIVWTDIAGRSVLSDRHIAAPADGSLREFHIYGKGRFYNKLNRHGDDSNGLNLRHNTLWSIQAEEICSIQLWSAYPKTRQTLLEGIKFIYNAQSANIYFRECTFKHGVKINFNPDESLVFDNCTFALPNLAIGAAAVNESLIIRDKAGTALFTINHGDGTIADITGLSPQGVADSIPNPAWTNNWTAPLFFSRPYTGSTTRTGFTRLINCKLIVERPNCMGLRIFQQSFNAPNNAIEIEGLTVINKTGGSATAVVTGVDPALTGIVRYLDHGIVAHGCDNLQLVMTSRNKLGRSYIPVGLATTEGVAELYEPKITTLADSKLSSNVALKNAANVWTSYQTYIRAAASGIITSHISGDAVSRFQILVEGKLEWGDGAVARDTFLYRLTAGILKTDGTLIANAFYSRSFFNPSNSQFSSMALGDSGATIATGTAANVVLKIQNTNAARTGDLLQLLDSAGAVLAFFGVNGDFISTGNITADRYITSKAALRSAWGLEITGLDNAISVPATGIHRFLIGGIEMLRLMPDGKVGIGISAPNERLEVAGNIRVSNGTLNRNVKITDLGIYMSRTSDGAYSGSIEASSSGELIYSSRHNHIFRTVGTTKFRLWEGGDIGIGTGDATPTARLEVKTDVAASVGLKVQNTNAARTADLQQWLDSAGGVLAKMDVNGALSAANLLLPATNGNGVRFFGNPAYTIYMSAIGDATHGGRMDATSDFNMYFKMNQTNNRGFVFMSNTTPVAQIDGGGNLYLKGEVKQGITVTGPQNIAPSFMVGIDEIPSTEKTKLDTAANWDAAGKYIGTPLVNCLQGQEYYTADGKYYIRMAQDNSPRRMALV